MNIKTATKLFYGIIGTGFLVVGLALISVDTGLLPTAVENGLMAIVNGDLKVIHVFQEFGAILVFVGIITFWFIRHYERSEAFHWAMASSWGLIALVHWLDVRGPLHSGIGPVINTVPFAIFLIVGLLRRRSDRSASARRER